jgi:preprotein translocase subunit SecF
MEFFNPDSKIDFMGLRNWTAIFSGLVFVLSIFALGYYGLTLGLDFTGGTQIEVHYQKSVDLQSIRDQLEKAGYSESSNKVISYGSSKDVLISIAPEAGVKQQDMLKKLVRYLPGGEIKRVEMVGPQVGKELATKGALAIIVSMLLTMIYIAMRFEYRFAISSVIALIHDPLLILGVFAFLGMEFDLKALAALLAVIGYSLNDTIVVFDRVRENFKKLRKADPIEVMNISINQTLSRTVMTSALTLFVVIALFLYGGEAIHGFALALMIGILIGTYSSIYVAGAFAVALGLNRQDFLPSKRVIDDTP